MRHTTKFQSLTLSQSAEPAGRLPYQAPESRVFTFRSGDPLCDSNKGDLIEGDGGTTTGNSDEGSGYNNPDNP